MATDGDELALKPGENLGVHLTIIKEELGDDGALLRGVSACVPQGRVDSAVDTVPLLLSVGVATIRQRKPLDRMKSRPGSRLLGALLLGGIIKSLGVVFLCWGTSQASPDKKQGKHKRTST